MIALRMENGVTCWVRPEEIRQIVETRVHGRLASRVLLRSGSEPRWVTVASVPQAILDAVKTTPTDPEE